VVITLDFESKNPSSNLGKSCFQLVVLGEKSTYLTRLAQLVERMPFKHVVVGSSPTSGVIPKYVYKLFKTRLAQLVERMPFKHVVVGSSPTSGVIDRICHKTIFFLWCET
jgi:hypothetical protein